MDWFDNDEFWRELYPVMFPEDRFAAAGNQVDQILKLTGVSSGRVLDLCCGPGRHSQEFGLRGFSVTGVDRSDYLLSKARARSSLQIEWVREDMREFRREDTYDLACNLFSSFGYFEADDDNRRVLRNVYASLKPGGIFVMEMLGKERAAQNWQSAICTDFPDGITLLQRPRICDDWSRVENEWTLLKEGRTQTFRFKHWIYSGRELADLLRGAGFEQVRLCGDLGGTPYGLDSMRLIAVARKA